MKKIMDATTYSEVDGLEVSEVEVIYKVKVKPSLRPIVSQSKEVYE